MTKILARVVADGDAVSSAAADVIEELIDSRPAAVLALPTGRTPIALYRELVRRFRAGKTDWSAARAFNLDEWVGVSPDAVSSYAWFMADHLFSHVNIRPENCFIPNGMAVDLDAECLAYEKAIESVGGIDLAVLGLGRNGHIGFNEPGTSFDTRTHVGTVAEDTRRSNAYTFADGAPPDHAITVGISTIMKARRILLVVTGADKAAILETALVGPIDKSVPASILQRHDDVLVVADVAAASRLPAQIRAG